MRLGLPEPNQSDGDGLASDLTRATLLWFVQGVVLGRHDSGQCNQEPLDGRGQVLIRPRVDGLRAVPSGGSRDRVKANPKGPQQMLEPDPPVGDLGAIELFEDLARHIALQDPDDLALRTTLLCAAFHVLASARVRGEARHDGAPQGLVDVSISTTVKPTPRHGQLLMRRWSCPSLLSLSQGVARPCREEGDGDLHPAGTRRSITPLERGAPFMVRDPADKSTCPLSVSQAKISVSSTVWTQPFSGGSLPERPLHSDCNHRQAWPRRVRSIRRLEVELTVLRLSHVPPGGICLGCLKPH